MRWKNHFRRYWKRYVLLVMCFIGLEAAYTWQANRLGEARYLNHVTALYLPQRFKEDGQWPSSLDQIEDGFWVGGTVDGRWVADAHWRDSVSEFILYPHRVGRPTLQVLATSDTHFEGYLEFAWRFGGRYRVEVDIERERFFWEHARK